MTVLEHPGDLDVVAPPTGEQAKLRRELGQLDTIFFLISAMVVVDTIGGGHRRPHGLLLVGHHDDRVLHPVWAHHGGARSRLAG
jgi:hypothetical protein